MPVQLTGHTNSALRATDEVLTNFGSSAEISRWLAMCATLEREESSDAADLPSRTGVGTGAPLAVGGAFPGDVR